MDRVLICVGTAQGYEKISALFDNEKYATESATDAITATNRLNNEKFAIVLIVPPFCGTDGVSLAVGAAESTTAAVVILCKREQAAIIENKTRGYGIFIVSPPISKAAFDDLARLMTAFGTRLELLHRDKIALQGKIEELKLLDRAKCVLIQYLGMTEKDAHRFIEKKAMDSRVSKREIIENILKTYES